MQCPFCKATDTRVVDSRLAEDGTQVRRRRGCEACDARFTTFERAELPVPLIKKRSGRAEAFDEAKLRRGIGSDPRIGYHFIYPGVGYGGSCFPKDTLALVRTAQHHGARTRLIETTVEVNDARKKAMADKVEHEGACHCGAVRFRVRLTGGLAEARRCSCSSSCSSFSRSPCNIFVTGIPVAALTTSAISFSVTLVRMSLGSSFSSATSACSRRFCNSGITPYCRRAASAKSPSRLAFSKATRA